MTALDVTALNLTLTCCMYSCTHPHSTIFSHDFHMLQQTIYSADQSHVTHRHRGRSEVRTCGCFASVTLTCHQ